MTSVRILIFLACVTLLIVTACQPIQPKPTPPAPAVATPGIPADGRVDLGGRKLFLSCSGEGAPTVILEAGLAGDHGSWELVQAEAATYSRVCSYDRAGLGESDPAPTPRTSKEVVADLHQLLAQAGEDAPYLLVGHSFGGLHTRLFADTYPDEVVGMILIDAVHEEWWSRGVELLPAEVEGEEAQIAELRRYFASEGGEPEENGEGIDIAASVAQVRKSGNFANKPLVVLVAGIPDVLPPGLPSELQAALHHLLQQELPAELVKLSPNSIQVDVQNSGHDIPHQRPDLVLTAIKTLVEMGR